MGSIMSAIRDDEDEYDALCERFGEKAQPGGPYNAHRDALKKRAHDEWQAKLKKERAPKSTAPKPKKPERVTVADRILESMDED